ncbi:50S ribosomal protein L15 [Telmatocola sphagniphila]|jgi:large subunit ribosomal protein L15|uniref:Large ribosomal subunit protein uL15 n=1 Tax=Telmatocola sphagniphila TaxID=1123043 RepID=A0A8E6B3M5_9BACT|nr:50S ribosomal protein L15 [Telmatocola sphagniphila]QVL30839.1 50S ribosomal protein L15 [Telmatocola sphagniphila]
MDLTNVHAGTQKRKLKKRVGRGVGSGQGKTAGRGHKGQYASAGARLPGITFVGGQTPLFRRVPKRGFNNARFRATANVVNVGDLDIVYNDGDVVTAESLRENGLATRTREHVRILGDGELTKKLTIRANYFSKSALEKIQAKGGTADLIPLPKKPVRNKMKPKKAKD